MRSFRREGVQPATAEEAIRESYRNPELQQLCVSLIGGEPPSRKDDMAVALLKLLDGDRLADAVRNLSGREREMLAQTAWSQDGFFDRDLFNARHERTVDTGSSQADNEQRDEHDDNTYGRGDSRKRKRTWIELLMPHGVLARDLQQRVRLLLPEPTVPSVHATDTLPASIDQQIYVWNPATRTSEPVVEAVPLEIREMERSAPRDLLAALRLVDAGKVGISEKNRTPTPGAIGALAAVLDGGDFYPDKNDEEKSSAADGDKPGPIRAYAWPLLLQAGKLARAKGLRLELTPAGRTALLGSPAEVLRDLWAKWLKSDLLDELRRINVIRGQTGNGKRSLTNPVKRREAIVAALRECPVGEWVSLNEFSRHTRAAGHLFEVTTDPWTLYIVDAQYGSLAYDGGDEWNILQFRYVLCLLMEYAATLGIVDVSYIPPEGARDDFRGRWGTDDLSFFSQYDGLMHLRLTNLGAYILGIHNTFKPSESLAADSFVTVNDDLEIEATKPLTAADVMLLETYTSPVNKRTWRLDEVKILDAEADGRSVEELISFLESATTGELPSAVVDFFADIIRRTSALEDLGPARLIGCLDRSLAHHIGHHPETAKWCSLAGPDRLVVADKHRSAFDRSLKKLGFVLRRTSVKD